MHVNIAEFYEGFYKPYNYVYAIYHISIMYVYVNYVYFAYKIYYK